MKTCGAERHPKKVRFSIPSGSLYRRLANTIQNLNLHTICLEAKCPNVGECFALGESAFLIMGDVCTRNCRYCSVKHGEPRPLNWDELTKIAEAAALLKMNYIIITSPARDDLEDKGAAFFAQSLTELSQSAPDCAVELLVPDFAGNMEDAIDMISAFRPAVLNHNIETTRNLFASLRPMGDYDLSLKLLARAVLLGNAVKSGFMVGFGETMDEISATLNDLRDTGCTMITVGQYLRPNFDCVPVVKYYTDKEFAAIRTKALNMGFKAVEAGQHIRSSYRASDMLNSISRKLPR